MSCAAIRLSIRTFFFVPLLLTACGGGGGGGGIPPIPPAPTYTIGGTISGHADTVVLQNNSGDTLTLSVADTSFVFDIALVNGAPFSVTVIIQPAGQTCTVTGGGIANNGTGTVSGTNITDIQVNCPPIPTYTIGGTAGGGGGISGLSGTVELQNNGGDTLSRSANGDFSFATELPSGADYSVTVNTQPSGQTCVVSGGGNGTVASSDVTNVAVTCTNNPPLTYTIGGTITGLTGTVVLRNNGGDTITRNNNGSFTFATVLADAAVYNVTVFAQPFGQTCTVSGGGNGNGGGTVMSSNVTSVAVNCVTNGKFWRTAATIENNNAGGAIFPQIAIDVNGNALAVWSQSDGTRYNIWANRYTAGAPGSWGTAVLIETNNSGNALNPQIAIDASGNAIAVWQQFDVPRYNIWANRYTAGVGWGTAALIETDDLGEAIRPQIAFDPSGNALAVWQHSDGILYNIYANRYTAGAGWGTAAPIDGAGNGIASFPQIAIDASGNAIAVWQQVFSASRFDIVACFYTSGADWGTPATIESNNAGSAFTPQIAFDAGGNAIAVWQQSDGTPRTDIWANRYTAGAPGSWGIATLIETSNLGSALSPQIAFDTSGNAIAVWQQSDGVRDNIWARRYSAGWGATTLIETSNLGNAGSPQIVIDTSATPSNGDALVVWHQSDGARFNIWSNRFSSGAWDTAGQIETNNAGSALFPQIAISPGTGNAIAVWSQSNGSREDIWANHYE